MTTVESTKTSNLKEHLEYLTALFTLISKICHDGPKPEQIDEASKEYYFTNPQEKTEFQELLRTARQYENSERNVRTDNLNEKEMELNDRLTKYFNGLFYMFISPLTTIKDFQNKVDYLTQEVLKSQH
jgi:hypothetical protein